MTDLRPSTAIPWRDQAVLIRTNGARVHDGGRAIVAEGPLFRLVAIVDALAPDELERHYIALPERRAAPFRYESDGIRTLLGRIDRPGTLDLLNARCAAATPR